MHLRMLERRAYDVRPLQAQLENHPEVWNTIRLRTEHSRSPHREVDDIWIRYNSLENYQGDLQAFNAEHIGEWYPAAQVITEARRLAEQIAADHASQQLGAVLITRIPGHKQVYPHVDGGWHAGYYDKLALQVCGNEQQTFHVEQEQLVTCDGDLYQFQNEFPHWVLNPSDEARITLITCIRR